MTPHPDDEYIITDHELTLFATNGFWDRAERIATYKKVMSCPHSSAKSEQENVLDELWEICEKDGVEIHGDLVAIPGEGGFLLMKLVKKIQELRKGEI